MMYIWLSSLCLSGAGLLPWDNSGTATDEAEIVVEQEEGIPIPRTPEAPPELGGASGRQSGGRTLSAQQIHRISNEAATGFFSPKYVS